MIKSILDNILASHKLWIETNGKGGNRANLSCASLSCASLSGANLSRADLNGANLEGANLTGANLEGANLEGANLEGANVLDANLVDANLKGANLTGAVLYYANLEGANLTGANLKGADLCYANLTGAIGLPDVSRIEPGCLVQLNKITHGFLSKETGTYVNFVQDSLGLIIKLNHEEKTFDILVSDQIIRGISDWVKYSGITYSAKILA